MRPFNLVPLAEIAPERRRSALAADDRGTGRRRRTRGDRAQGARAALRREPSRRRARRAALARPRRRLDGQAHRAARRRRQRDACSTASSRWSPTCAPTRPASTCRASPSCSKRRRSTCSRGPMRRRAIEDVVGAARARDRRLAGRPARRRAAARRIRARALDAGEREARRGDLHADRDRARRRARDARRVVGVEAEGMTACPCAQVMVREHRLRELDRGGLHASADASARSRRSRSRRTTSAAAARCSSAPTDGTRAELRAEDLVEIVESSMSSETYDLLKRPDEFFVVNKAHHNPKFVEDVVRGILARALDVYADFPRRRRSSRATQINDESIHKHDAFAEAFGTFGELRARTARAACTSTRRPTSRPGSGRAARRHALTRSAPGDRARAVGVARADGRAHRRRRRVRDQLARDRPRRSATATSRCSPRSASTRRACRSCGRRCAPHDPHAARSRAGRARAWKRCARRAIEPIVTLAPPRQRAALHRSARSRVPRALGATTPSAVAARVPLGAALDADQRAADDGALLDALRRLVSEPA